MKRELKEQVLAILLAILFLVSLTAVAGSAGGRGGHFGMSAATTTQTQSSIAPTTAGQTADPSAHVSSLGWPSWG